MNEVAKEQPAGQADKKPRSPGWHTQNFHRLAARFFQFTDKHRYAPVAAAAGAALAVFGVGAGACSALGTSGSVVFLILALVSLATFSVVHAALLYRSRAQVQSLVQPVQLSEVRSELDQLLPRIDQDTGEAIQRIVVQYETQIRDFQDTLSRIRPREIPGKPVIIEAGPLMMGSKKGQSDEKPRHEVYVSAFLIDQYQVMNRQIADFINDPANRAWRREGVYERYGIPYHLSDWDGLVPPIGKWDHPVVLINWFACCAFCNWRSQKDKKQEVYTFISDLEVKADFSKDGWRLPTEAEWEKAARGGRDNLLYPWEGLLSPTLANYGKHYRGTTPVGQFPPNDLGVFDMLGNVKEWCHDCYCATTYEERAQGPVKDPAGNDSGLFRAFRGGSWLDEPQWVHLSKRGRIPAQNMNIDFGFRCIRRP